MTPQEQQIEQIKSFLNTAKVRSGLSHQVISIQTDLSGAPSGIRGTVDIPEEKGGFKTVEILWNWNGRSPADPMLDLVVEILLTEYSDETPAPDTTQPGEAPGEVGGGDTPQG